MVGCLAVGGGSRGLTAAGPVLVEIIAGHMNWCLGIFSIESGQAIRVLVIGV